MVMFPKIGLWTPCQTKSSHGPPPLSVKILVHSVFDTQSIWSQGNHEWLLGEIKSQQISQIHKQTQTGGLRLYL